MARHITFTNMKWTSHMKIALMLLSYKSFFISFLYKRSCILFIWAHNSPQKIYFWQINISLFLPRPPCAEIHMEACINSYGSPHKFAWRATKIYMDVHENSEKKKHVNSQRSQHESKWNSRSIHMDVHINPHGIHIHQNGLSIKFT